MENGGTFKLGIGIPCNNTHVPIEFLQSFSQLLSTIRNIPYTILFADFDHVTVDLLRNEIVGAAQKHDCSHVLFLDTDHIFHPRTIISLLEKRKSIVGGLCYKRTYPYHPVMYKGEFNFFDVVRNWEDGELVEVDSTGTGCLLIETAVFDKLQKPYFKFAKNEEPDASFPVIGEDAWFCLNAKKAGYKIYVDTSIPSQHLSTIPVDKEVWESFGKLS